MKKTLLTFSAFFAFALSVFPQTGGPGQPEFMQFQQAGTADLVNPASGTFSYQIPLFTIGGYPMNLTYQSGILMEDVASMAGLGWNVNAGSIVRTKRFLPDDFDGDLVIKEYYVKPNTTFGGKIGADVEIAGLPDRFGLTLGAELGVFFNNYKGWGMDRSISGSGSFSLSKQGFGPSASLGLGSSVNSQGGVDKYITPALGWKVKGNDGTLSMSLGHTWSVNSSEGKKTSINASMSMVRATEGKRRDPGDKAENKKKKEGEADKKTGKDFSSTALMGFTHNSYLNNSFQPDIEHPFVNMSGNFSGTLGLDGYYVDPSFRVTGYYSLQMLSTPIQTFKAYGMMYEGRATDENAIMDFNREKRLPLLMGSTPNLPVPFNTPDVFNLSAQGLMLSFSIVKNDIGVVGDPDGVTSSAGMNAGAEVNLGQIVKAGANIGTTFSSQNTGKLPQPFFEFLPGQQVIDNHLYREFCFRNNAEVNLFNQTAFETMGKYGAVQFDIVSENAAASRFINGKLINDNVLNTANPVRQSNIEYLTAGEAEKAGFQKEITYYEFDNPTPFKLEWHDGASMPYRKSHHLAEISVTQPDGMKYIFGLPVYNIIEKEVNFNVSGRPFNKATNLVHYEQGKDNSSLNKQGIDNYFDATTTPAYVTQFLITAVLGTDYRDLTGDGISDDDLGNFVKFTYYKEPGIYNWRTPFGKDSATYNIGLRSDPKDDRGSYVYGEKELWYICSLQSKTEIAEFFYSPRKDGFGVLGEDGGKNDKCFLRQLDSIVVYSLPDREQNGKLATPVKTIHFYFDNSLCTGIDNGETAQTGKLKLNALAFTYEKSAKGKLSPYSFEYGKLPNGDIMNPGYDSRSVNNWGYYQPNKAGDYSDCDNNANLSNIDYPYSSQDKTEMNKNAYAWNLTGITIPGGGKLSVEYESHDYAFVQNKTAGQMFKVTGITSSINPDMNGKSLYTNDEDESGSNNRIYFKLQKPMTGTAAQNRAKLEQDYIQDLTNKYLYYKFFVQMTDGSSPDQPVPTWEYVCGYARINNFGVAPDGIHGFIDIEEADLDDQKKTGVSSAIAKMALQFMRMNLSNMVFQNPTLGEPASFVSFIQSIPSVLEQMSNQREAFHKGVNKYCKTQNFCKYINPEKSFIRLYSPDQFKLAGGSRAFKVSIDDNWDEIAGNTESGKSYSTLYLYTTEKNDSVNISSGVAEYEPMLGGDQIPLKQPIRFEDVKKSAPDTQYYVETPYNESLFPAPQITYSKVTQISNPSNEISNPNKKEVGKTGKIVNEFFTAKDFPVWVDFTGIDMVRDKSGYNPAQNPFIALDAQHDYVMASQGFSIVLNNMSGLAKATWVYNENGDRVSGEVSEYFPSNDKFITIDRYGAIHNPTTLGLSVDYTVDGRRSFDQSVSTSCKANLNISIVGILPIPILMPQFSLMTEEKQCQSLVVNKIIHQNAILKSKTVYSQSATITTENLAFDQVTGEVLLTKTTNEFNDTLFSFKYPAWWIYPAMGPAYENSKLWVTSLNKDEVKQFLKPGDELRGVDGGPRLWVTDPAVPKFVTDENQDAEILPFQMFEGGPVYIVYNSGAKNLLSSPAGQIVTWKFNPLQNGHHIDFGQANTLNSSAVQFGDTAVLYCDSCDLLRNRLGKNDFLNGRKGNYKPVRDWFYLAERTPGTIVNGVTNIKNQGLFKNYNDFWMVPANASVAWDSNTINWEWKEKVNLRDVDGQTLETGDRIGRLSSNLLGYKNTMVTAQAVNAGYGEIYSEGFEDYYYAFCPLTGPLSTQSFLNNERMKRVKLEEGNLLITNKESHTGKYSLIVQGGLSFSIYPPENCDNTQGGAWNGSLCTDCIGGFNPEKDKEYVFSCWVKVNNPPPVITCSEASVVITPEGKAPVTLVSDGPMIEGWQRVMGNFTTAANTNEVTVKLRPGTDSTFFDDLRIFPAEGNLVAYVYDDVKLKLTYSLDENNYYTKNEYNNQGELIRIKRETEEGIVTLQEGTTSLVKVKTQ